MQPETRSSLVTLPGAIIIAGAVIAVAIIWVKRPSVPPASPAGQQADVAQVNVPAVTSADHILGNPAAPIKIVEYSDPSCPYCKMFNPTMVQIMNDYGPGGKVAWIYRHFPIDKPGTTQDGGILHPNAGHEAEAMECAGSLGGNDKFWAFEKALYAITPSVTPQSPNGLDQKQLPDIAKSVGIDPVAFNECLSSGQFKSKIDQEYTDGINAGISGTPTSFIFTPTNGKIPLIGAQPYGTVKSTIDTLLTETN
jgi:protein-disulfide isomerase